MGETKIWYPPVSGGKGIEILNETVSPGATSRGTGAQAPSRIKKFVSGSKNCHPIEKFSGVQVWRDLLRIARRTSSVSGSVRSSMSWYSASVIIRYVYCSYNQSGYRFSTGPVLRPTA